MSYSSVYVTYQCEYSTDISTLRLPTPPFPPPLTLVLFSVPYDMDVFSSSVVPLRLSIVHVYRQIYTEHYLYNLNLRNPPKTAPRMAPRMSLQAPSFDGSKSVKNKKKSTPVKLIANPIFKKK